MTTQDDIFAALSKVIDPEIGLSITDMGLIYDVEVDGGKVNVKMTLTTMGCPMASHLRQLTEEAVARVKGVTQAQVELVWDPPWNPSMMTKEARLRLGMA
jgi:metal-sulfur cluster biosynthetic enzyme